MTAIADLSAYTPPPGALAANVLNLDYRAEAARLGPPVVPVIDAHIHVNGAEAARVYRQVMDLFGIERVWSQTHLEQVHAVREVLGDRLALVAVPNFSATDREAAFTTEWLRRIEKFADLGARICKFWTAPRARDFAGPRHDEIFALDGKWRREGMKVARQCGMMFKVHVADPDTWFVTKYSDASRYGTKRDQYTALFRMIEEYADTQWILAHMGGYPESLEFLEELLTRFPNVVLDTSATKWMIRELSRHSREKFVGFCRNWSGRLLFGSDIVTTDDHMHGGQKPPGMGDLATNSDEAFILYASRYFALRTFWETNYAGPSPIADPDLAMVDPVRFTPMDAPRLDGKQLPADLLKVLYRGAALAVQSRHESSGSRRQTG